MSIYKAHLRMQYLSNSQLKVVILLVQESSSSLYTGIHQNKKTLISLFLVSFYLKFLILKIDFKLFSMSPHRQLVLECRNIKSEIKTFFTILTSCVVSSKNVLVFFPLYSFTSYILALWFTIDFFLCDIFFLFIIFICPKNSKFTSLYLYFINYIKSKNLISKTTIFLFL